MRLMENGGLIATDNNPMPTVTRETTLGDTVYIVVNLPGRHAVKLTPLEARDLAKRLIDFIAD